MKKFSLFASIAFAAVLAITCVPANAGNITPQLYDPGVGFNVNVTYGNSQGGLTGLVNANTSSSPQVDPVSFGQTPVYCVDLWHDNVLGNSYVVNPTNLLPTSDIGLAPGNATAISAQDASNRIGWILSQAPSNTDYSQTAVDERGAIQLAIWYTTDAYYVPAPTGLASSFSYTGGDTAMRSDYDTLIGFGGFTFPLPPYNADANFYAAQHNGVLFQDLVIGNVTSVPEPSSVTLGCIGLFLICLWNRHRRAN
jgi:hypothetical protein